MSLPYFNMYPTDFEAKTSHLTLEEDGAYNRLLRLCWMTPGCSIPDDAAWIMRRMRCDKETFERVVLVVLDEFFERKNGRVSNARLTKEFERSNDAHKKRVSAGSRGGKAKALKTNKSEPSNAKAMLKQPEPEPEPYSDTNVSGADAPLDPEKIMFDAGVKLLTSAGMDERKARSFIGAKRKANGPEAVMAAIGAATRAGAVEPVAFIQKVLAKKPAASGANQNAGAFGILKEVG